MQWQVNKKRKQERLQKAFKIGDEVLYLREDRVGRVLRLNLFNEEALVRGVHLYKNQFERPVRLSACLLICSRCKTPTKVKFMKDIYIKENGKVAEKLVRICDKCGERIDDDSTS